MAEVWAVGDAYERFMGRWSRRAAAEFVNWLTVPAGRTWLDVGCGTGALSAGIIALADPTDVVGVDSSTAFVEMARSRADDVRAGFGVADAAALPFSDRRFDVTVSGLMLNFASDPVAVVAEMVRVTRAAGLVAAYVWDYAEGMAMLRQFWDAAASVDPLAAALDEGSRFPLCHPDSLRALWTSAGLTAPATRPLRVSMHFRSFEDFWDPYLGGQGPASGYLMSLPEENRSRIADVLRDRLPVRPDGSISLAARAWAVRGRTPEPR
jgi:SAM-dependent methyltransferase